MSDRTRRDPWRPKWLVVPGEVLRERFQELGLTGVEAAKRLGVTPPYISGLLNSTRSLTAHVAVSLEAITGTSAEFWCGLQTTYDLAVERQIREAGDKAEAPRKLTLKRGETFDD